MEALKDLNSIPGVCEVALVAGPGCRQGAPPDLLIEIPHGATRRRHFDETRRRLVGTFADDLVDYFHVNTDVGSIECARHVARMMASPEDALELADLLGSDGAKPAPNPCRVLIVRGLIPRTFVDCNRVLEGGPTAELRNGVTPGLAEYITRPEDVETLTGLHRDYQGLAERAYEVVCGAGGAALILHTYAPRSVEIDRVDDGIVAALHRAYEVGVYERWKRRPDAEVISEDDDGTMLAARDLIEALRRSYARIGVRIAENETYRLHAGTVGYEHSMRYPGRVLCMEINRGLLADPYTPFEEMRIGDDKARRMAAPIAAAWLTAGEALGVPPRTGRG